MLRRKETLADKLWRWRGVLFVLAIPAFVILLVTLYGPRASPNNDGAQLGNEAYSVVFDAGSTGSRVHVFRFQRVGADLQLLKDDFKQIQPGLGDAGWAADPERAATSLQPLLDHAIESVPREQHASTLVELRATAGLRLLPGTQADDILRSVERLLEASPFQLVQDGVSVMDGADEGAFAWLTLNYLLGKAGKPAAQLVGAIDLGGGSVQQAFAVDDTVAKSAPDGYIRKMAAGGREYNVYVHSYLGFGLMQGRGAVLAADGGAACVNAGTSGTYKSPYGGSEVALAALPGGGDAAACGKAVTGTLHAGKACGAEVLSECTFGGAWGGAADHSGRTFYAMSYFFDRALAAGIVTDASAKVATVAASDFQDAAERACSAELSSICATFPAVPDGDERFLCLDLTFQYTLLTAGLKVAPDTELTLVRQVKYRGEWFEAAWPLGAAINTLSADMQSDR